MPISPLGFTALTCQTLNIRRLLFTFIFISICSCSESTPGTPSNTAVSLDGISETTMNTVSASSPAPHKTISAPSIDVLAEKLRKRLHENPQDVDGWVLLARSYHHLQQFDSAAAAMQQAQRLGYADTSYGIEATSTGRIDAVTDNHSRLTTDHLGNDKAAPLWQSMSELTAEPSGP